MPDELSFSHPVFIVRKSSCKVCLPFFVIYLLSQFSNKRFLPFHSNYFLLLSFNNCTKKTKYLQSKKYLHSELVQLKTCWKKIKIYSQNRSKYFSQLDSFFQFFCKHPHFYLLYRASAQAYSMKVPPAFSRASFAVCKTLGKIQSFSRILTAKFQSDSFYKSWKKISEPHCFNSFALSY